MFFSTPAVSPGRIENESQMTGILHALRSVRSIGPYPRPILDSGGPLCIVSVFLGCLVLCLSISAVDKAACLRPTDWPSVQSGTGTLAEWNSWHFLRSRGLPDLFTCFIACHLYLVTSCSLYDSCLWGVFDLISMPEVTCFYGPATPFRSATATCS